jgi:hypothetical protein
VAVTIVMMMMMMMMMPPTAKKTDYARRRARAITLERLGPVRRRRIINAIAANLAEGRGVPRDWFTMLDDEELTRAFRLSAKLAAMRKWRRIMTAIEAVPLRVGETCYRAIRFVMRSGPNQT